MCEDGNFLVKKKERFTKYACLHLYTPRLSVMHYKQKEIMGHYLSKCENGSTNRV
jgi:hypothetical protein